MESSSWGVGAAEADPSASLRAGNVGSVRDDNGGTLRDGNEGTLRDDNEGTLRDDKWEGAAIRSGSSTISGCCLRSSSIRMTEAVPRWNRLTTQPMAIDRKSTRL